MKDLFVGILIGALGIALLGVLLVNMQTSQKTPAANSTTRERTQKNQSPIAIFSVSPSSGNVPLEVSFDASSANDPDGSIRSYTWDFGDGSKGRGLTATHTYRRPGDYTAELTVIDGEGSRDFATKNIKVNSTGDKENKTPDNNRITITILEEVVFKDTDTDWFRPQGYTFTDPYYFVYVCDRKWVSEAQWDPEDESKERAWHSTSIGRPSIVEHTFNIGALNSCRITVEMYDAGINRSIPEEDLAQNTWEYNISEGRRSYTHKGDKGGFKIVIAPE